jgi:hypothetical protein
MLPARLPGEKDKRGEFHLHHYFTENLKRQDHFSDNCVFTNAHSIAKNSEIVFDLEMVF